METKTTSSNEGKWIFIIIGTSLNVYPAAGLLNYAPANIPVYLIDPNDVNARLPQNAIHIRKGASEGMRILIDEYLCK